MESNPTTDIPTERTEGTTVEWSLVVTKSTIIASVGLSLIGIIFNTTRFTLTGAALLLWGVSTVLVAVLFVHVTQYMRVKYSPRKIQN